MRKEGMRRKGVAVAWQQPLLSAVQQGISAVARHGDGSSPLRTAAQALLHCQVQMQPRLEAPAEIEASLLLTRPDGSPQLNVRVVDAMDREDFSGKPYVAFLLRCRFGDREWTLEKRFSKFHALHEQLVMLLGRDLAARLPSLPPRLPSLLGQHAGCSSREVQDRRWKLDLYIQGLAKLAAAPCGPMEGCDVSSGDDDSPKNMLHVMHELYKYVEFVGHVVPGKGDRALDDDEDNSDEERENESSFQNPALVHALTQVKRLREQLVDKQLAIDSARELKLHLGQQLVQTQEEVAQLEQTLVQTSNEIEAVLLEQYQQQQEQLLSSAKGRGLDYGAGTSPSSSRADSSRPSHSYVPVTSPFASAAAAVSNRFWQKRSAQSAWTGPWSPAPVSEPPASSRLLGESSPAVQGPDGGAPSRAAACPEGGGLVEAGGGTGGQGVDEFAVTLHGVREKLQLLKDQHFCQRRSWVSRWRGEAREDVRWREIEAEVQNLSLLLEEEGEEDQEGVARGAGEGASVAAAARARLQSVHAFTSEECDGKVEWRLKVTALNLLRDNVALWKGVRELAAAKRRAVDKMSSMSLEGARVGRMPSASQEPSTLLASLRSLAAPSRKPSTRACSSPAAHGGPVWSPGGTCAHAKARVGAALSNASQAAGSSPCRSSSPSGGQAGGEEDESGEALSCSFEREQRADETGGIKAYFETPVEGATRAPSVRERVSSFVMHARTSLGVQRGSKAENGEVDGQAGRGYRASESADARSGFAEPETEDLSGLPDIATAVGDLSRTMEEGIYLMTSELEDIALNRSTVQRDISAATRQLEQLQAELVQVEGETDDAMTRAHTYAEVTRSMAEHERYLSLERDGLLLDDAC